MSSETAEELKAKLAAAEESLASLRAAVRVVVEAEECPGETSKQGESVGRAVHESHEETKPSKFEQWIDQHQERERVAQRFGRESWNLRVLNRVTGHRVQLFFSALLVLDVMIVAVELFMNAEWPACATIRKHSSSCCPIQDNHTAHSEMKHDCDPGFAKLDKSPVACSYHEHVILHNAHQALFGLSIMILVVFEIELTALLFALRGLFCYNPLYIMDLVIVTITLISEAVMYVRVLPFDAASIILLARTWRFFRVGHGLVISVHERDMEKVSELRRSKTRAFSELRKLAWMEPLRQDEAGAPRGDRIPGHVLEGAKEGGEHANLRAEGHGEQETPV